MARINMFFCYSVYFNNEFHELNEFNMSLCYSVYFNNGWNEFH